MAFAAVSLSRCQYLVVDLDGTLVLTDTFAANVLEAIRRRPMCLFTLIAALFRGRAACKQAAAAEARIDVSSLPYNQPLLQHLRQEHALGRRLILATGSDSSIAARVAGHLGIFDSIIASDGIRNMTGDHKVGAIRDRIGDIPFTYAGNSRSDLRVWRKSQAAILVGVPQSWAVRLRKVGVSIENQFEGTGQHWSALLRCLRPHQWSKNMLVFVPAVLAHQLGNVAVMSYSLVAFFGISFCASAFYIVNDLLDMQADRLHPTKRRRPLAAGEVSIEAALVLIVLLLSVTVALASFLPWQAAALLAAYAASSLTYSLKIKRMLFLDVVSLSLLYAVRVLYGGAASGIKISLWTLAFSLFLFSSLATVKRVAELRRVKVNVDTEAYRGYKEADINQLSSLASSSGCVAVLVLALYINSPEVQLLYRHSQFLWLLCPILIYWIGRLTLIANRGHLDDDPVSFALKDRATWVVGLLSAIILAVSA